MDYFLTLSRDDLSIRCDTEGLDEKDSTKRKRLIDIYDEKLIVFVDCDVCAMIYNFSKKQNR